MQVRQGTRLDLRQRLHLRQAIDIGAKLRILVESLSANSNVGEKPLLRST